MRFLRSGPVGFVLMGILIAVLGWNAHDLVGRSGLDQSWNAALSIAAEQGLNWGREIVFTFGPLGYLQHPKLWYEGTGALAILYSFVTRAALAGALWYFARPAFGRVGAALVALLIVPFVPHPLPPVVFGWGLWLLARERAPRAWLAFAVAAGALAGVELLGKVNLGVLLVALGTVTVAFAPRDRVRLVLIYGAATFGGLLIAWIATGQRLLDLNDYLVNAARIASGYSSAMWFTVDDLAWHYSAALLVFAVAAYGVWTATSAAPRNGRLGALLLTLVLSFMAFKSAFVRHDPMHAVEFFGMLLPAIAVIPWHRAQRATGLMAVAAALLTMVALTGERLDRLVDPFERAGNAWSDVSLLVRPGERERLVEQGREQLRAQYGLDPAIVDVLRGHPVHVEPYEIALVWAYELEWRPAPVFHSYQAYTQDLDQLNADLLSSSSAPSRILLSNQEILDRRVGAWESPAALRAMLCNYQAFAESGGWVVLGRTHDRCGPARQIGSVTAEWGETVRVPPPTPEGMVIARIHGTGPGLGERLRTLLFKGHERAVELDGKGSFNPFIAGTAENGLLLSAPPGLELPPGYTKTAATKSLSIHHKGGADGTLRYDFFLVPYQP